MVKAALGEIAERGSKIYEETIRAILEPQHNGEYVVIDIDGGGYEFDKDFFAAADRAIARFGRERLYSTRIGYGAFCRIGGRFRMIDR